MTPLRFTLTHVRVPLVEPFRISNGSIAEKDGILVTITDDGVAGVGEASPMAGSFYSAETPGGTWDDLRTRLLPAVLAAHARTVAEANAVLGALGGNPFARAGIETAYWDLEARRAGVPMARLLGGEHDRVVSGLAVGITPTIDDLLATIERHMADGYRRVKIKVQPGWDVEPLEAIRRRFGDLPLMVDANCAYTRGDIEHLSALDHFGLMMIEQPLPRHDLEGHAELQRTIVTPVCLDEGAEDLAAVRRAIELKSCRIVNIKIQRVGGLLAARTIHDTCRAAGIAVWAGTMPELGVGALAAVHLATLPGFTYPTDVEASARWFVDDIVEPLITVRDGRIAVPTSPGLGHALNPAVISRYRVREETFSREGV
jgi:O-succinylbenzoate synthase